MPIRQRFSAAYRAFKDPSLLEAAVREDFLGPWMAEDGDLGQWYRLLEMYRDSKAYAEAQHVLQAIAVPEDHPKIRFLENPAYQAVQYGVMHIFGGPMEEAMAIVAEGNEQLALAAERVLTWSNFAQQKDTLSEDQYTVGDVFLKVEPKEDGTQVPIDVRHPSQVDWAFLIEDRLRNIKRMRIDIVLRRSQGDERAPNGNGGPGRTANITEYWTEIWEHESTGEDVPAGGRHRQWIHQLGESAKVSELGEPDFEATLASEGGNFVPWVRIPRKAGTRPNQRSSGIFELHLEPIDHLNRLATEFSEMWRENAEGVWAALRNEAGKDVVQMIDEEEEEEEDAAEESSATGSSKEPTEHEAHGRRIFRMPGAARMEDLVPNIDYQAGLDQIKDRREALERTMAELRYFRGIEQGDPSAAAIRMHQAPAIKAAEAARGNAEDGVLKAIKMAITYAQARGIAGFERSLGAFETGGFDDLAFKPRAIVPETPEEKAARELQDAQILTTVKNIGIPELLERALVARGFSEADAKRIAGEAAKRAERARQSSILNSGSFAGG